MPSTNKTQNISLSQFVASDKPAWLTDYNNDMSKIDAAIGNSLGAYPVGAVYISVVPTSPATLFGGTWEEFATGRVLVGLDVAQDEFNTIEKSGGEKEHSLNVSEMPQHTHKSGLSSTDVVSYHTTTTGSAFGFMQGNSGAGKFAFMQDAGEGLAHNNLPPYITCYMWKRTA